MLIQKFQNFVRFPTSSLFSSGSALLVLDTTFNPSLPISLKLGDANLDGFPDLLAITIAGRDQTPHLVYSVPCAANIVGCGTHGSGRRGWKLATKGVETLEAVKDARSVTFLDMDEDVSFIAFDNSIIKCNHFTPFFPGHLGHHGSTLRTSRPRQLFVHPE